MSVYANRTRAGSTSIDRPQQLRFDTDADEYEIDLPSRKNSLPNILPELSKIVRKLLPNELLLNVHVRNVEYIEHGCERFSGTLYMTIFRLVFAPDNEIENNNLISSGNKYIGEYDIPLTSIYDINVAPVDSRIGLRAFRSEQQGQSETKAFTILTRDFRNITFSKCCVKKSNSTMIKPEASLTKMETYIDALRVHTRFQDKEQLYPYLATQKPTINAQSPKSEDAYTIFSSSSSQSFDEDAADFCSSNDERINSYLTYQEWYDELQDANENRWIVDQNKFDQRSIAQDEGPFVRLVPTDDDDSFKDLIWHWTHTSEVETNRHSQQNKKPKQNMLVTVPEIGEITVPGDSRRRSTTESSLTYSYHYVHRQKFQRYNLAKFPCNLKRLETSYEKLVEICVTMEDDDEKWLTKLNTCKWLRYVSKALHGAASLAKLINYNNIQLAGSDIDNSCLMSSLIQIFLRPKCRTIKGFCELIVREWIIRGHPFRERFGQVISDGDKNPAQESPIFLLFLDCIHQLINQNPILFEFTEYFLIEIYHDVCYCYHHTFAFNSILERLNAIENYPKNTIILSSFDFSLYLYSDVYHLLKNQASNFILQKFSPPPPPPRTRPPPPSPSPREQPKKMSHIHELLKHSLSAPRAASRPSYRAEAPKQDIPLPSPPSPPPPPPPPPPINESPLLNAEQFEYDNIEAPQQFPSDLYVDWRIVNLVLWSKCYCRYDQNSMPTLSEQQLSSEINSRLERIQNARKKSQEQTTTDAFHSINHANSWYPEIFVTHV